MDILFIGTGAGLPSKTRNVSSICLRLLQERGRIWMFDCGEGTQHQILHLPVKLKQLEYLFVTHLHGDHVFGIPGLLSTRSSQGATTPLTIFGPQGIARLVQTMLEVSESHLVYPVEIREITQAGSVYEDGNLRVEAAFLEHTILSLGYRVIEHPRPGKLNASFLMELGVPSGPLYGKLKSGQDVQLPDGRILHAADVLFPQSAGRVITILGDTRPCATATTLSRDADVLIHDATFGQDCAELAPKYGHSTASDAAHTAANAKVKNLVLTHISQRYTDETVHQLQTEARLIFPQTTLAYDGLCFEVNAPE